VIYINHLDKSRQEHGMNGKLLWDVISGFYYARRQPLETGKSIYINMFVQQQVSEYRGESTASRAGENVRRQGGPRHHRGPVLKSEGLFQKTGEILIWLTDDERRIPVRMETKLKIGRVTAELKSFSVKN
jgi:hypothetical protein